MIDETAFKGRSSERRCFALEQGASSSMICDSAVSSPKAQFEMALAIDQNELLSIPLEHMTPHTSIWYYRSMTCLRSGDPKHVGSAQPNLGKTASYDTYQRDVASRKCAIRTE